MIERMLILLLLTALVALLWRGVGRRSLRRARRAPLPAEAEAALKRAGTAILFFSTASCAQCRSLQAPALRELEDELGQELAVVPIDATANRELSSHFGIVTVPATVVLNRRGVRSINLGFASATALRKQLVSA